VHSRTAMKSGCPFCDGRRATPGVNDLATLFPEIAAEANGWDPTVVNPNSHKQREFVCDLGHVTTQAVRRRVEATGCPVCQNDRVLVGFNDLATTHPEIAAQANGWDPTTVKAGTKKIVTWSCGHGHSWKTGVANRTKSGTGCPYCSGRQAIPGETDLATTHPEIAAQANGWDPTTVKAGTSRKLPWICQIGHQWSTTPSSRTSLGTGCPICSGHQVQPGFNDLATTHPEIAAQANGWDPTTVTAGNDRKKRWTCSKGHVWEAQPYSRTSLKTGCPYCSGRQAIPGETDLATTHPEIAAQANGWDPTTVTQGSGQRVSWKCPKGHEYLALIRNRTSMSSGCSVCANKSVQVSINDLATTHPEIAAQADGWDPTTVTAGSTKKYPWICGIGHRWSTPVYYRLESGCPVCSNKSVQVGFNDLATTHPEIAAQADGWDPTSLTSGSNKKVGWICDEGHRWKAVIGSRTRGPKGGSGCPSCANYGFNPSEPGWLYFLEHDEWDLFQIGITNDTSRRIGKHNSAGWTTIEVRGPMDGSLAKGLEAAILQSVKLRGAQMANRSDILQFDGWTEAWTKKSLKVTSLKDLLNWVHEDDEIELLLNNPDRPPVYQDTPEQTI
jgi:hypothetical protein